jgi:16S rRNA (cytosine1402-N4)-methyltransferase
MSETQLALPGIAFADQGEWTWSEGIEDEMSEESQAHVTVMRDEVVAALGPGPGLYVDATLGAGGHAEAILQASEEARLIGFDRDERALALARPRLAPFGDRVTFVHAPFSRIREELDAIGVGRVAGLCADLGVSSMQLDEADRGMSFRREGPVDMRMDMRSGETALELIERLDDDELADVIFEYGDERRSRRIARSLKRAVADGELRTTLDLRRAIVRAVGPVRIGGVDPATRTFQALRIAVNREMEELETLIEALPHVLAPGGVAAVISFHSLEDRLVKRAFQQKQWAPLWKKPLVPSEDERAKNARSRSAKLRVARLVEEESGG